MSVIIVLILRTMPRFTPAKRLCAMASALRGDHGRHQRLSRTAVRKVYVSPDVRLYPLEETTKGFAP
jgi:hypothetical protein